MSRRYSLSSLGSDVDFSIDNIEDFEQVALYVVVGYIHRVVLPIPYHTFISSFYLGIMFVGVGSIVYVGNKEI